MNRQKFVEELKKQSDKVWDIIVIGGGATGLELLRMLLHADLRHYYLNNLILPRPLLHVVQSWFMEVYDIWPRVTFFWLWKHYMREINVKKCTSSDL